MKARLLRRPTHQSFFLLGPRGTGKTAWLRASLPDALFFVDRDQVADYQVRKGMTLAEVERWLGPNLAG